MIKLWLVHMIQCKPTKSHTYSCTGLVSLRHSYGPLKGERVSKALAPQETKEEEARVAAVEAEVLALICKCVPGHLQSFKNT